MFFKQQEKKDLRIVSAPLMYPVSFLSLTCPLFHPCLCQSVCMGAFCTSPCVHSPLRSSLLTVRCSGVGLAHQVGYPEVQTSHTQGGTPLTNGRLKWFSNTLLLPDCPKTWFMWFRRGQSRRINNQSYLVAAKFFLLLSSLTSVSWNYTPI